LPICRPGRGPAGSRRGQGEAGGGSQAFWKSLVQKIGAQSGWWLPSGLGRAGTINGPSRLAKMGAQSSADTSIALDAESARLQIQGRVSLPSTLKTKAYSRATSFSA